jgi:2,4-dienoyl-CoA reductase-like NADH-dependent reductase (Old Yellow Enzyme family)
LTAGLAAPPRASRKLIDVTIKRKLDVQTKLFSPLRLRDITLRNRIVLAPMLTYSAKNGMPSDWHLAHYGKFAVGGAGLVFVESTKVDPRGCTTAADLGLWKDEFIEPMRRISGFIKRHGAAAGIQRGHSGRKARKSLPWEGRAPDAALAGVDHGEPWELIGPSAVAFSAEGHVPREMTRQDIDQLVAMWGAAARRANEAGFDVLEIHGAHGYILHQFLSSSSNLRTDGYGGSFENRMRFPREVARAVRANWPDSKPLFIRISAVDEAGWTIEESCALVKALMAEGVDVVDCSSGGMTVLSIVDSGPRPSLGYQVPYAETVRKQTGAKTMAVGLIIHPKQAEGILQSGQSDLVALGREFLYNPQWPLHAAVELGADKPYEVLPQNYSYWLEKRAARDYRNI